MTNEAKLQQDASRAAQVRHLVESDLLNEAFQTLEQSYTDAWRATHALDVNAREKLFIAVNVIGKVRDHLHKVLADGKLAEKELKALTDEAARKKRFLIV